METLKLEQLPGTEEEYFVLIDSVMGVLGNDLSLSPSERYKILLERGKFGRDEINVHLFRSLTTMVEALCLTFHVQDPLGKVHLDNTAVSFDDWYARMMRLYNVNNYDQLICSVCPFSLGAREFTLQGKIVCRKNLRIRKLLQPFLCGMMSFGGWSEHDLQREIVLRHGEEVWRKFLAKEQEIVRRLGVLIDVL